MTQGGNEAGAMAAVEALKAEVASTQARLEKLEAGCQDLHQKVVVLDEKVDSIYNLLMQLSAGDSSILTEEAKSLLVKSDMASKTPPQLDLTKFMETNTSSSDLKKDQTGGKIAFNFTGSASPPCAVLDIEHSDVVIEAPADCSTKCPGHVLDTMERAEECESDLEVVLAPAHVDIVLSSFNSGVPITCSTKFLSHDINIAASTVAKEHLAVLVPTAATLTAISARPSDTNIERISIYLIDRPGTITIKLFHNPTIQKSAGPVIGIYSTQVPQSVIAYACQVPVCVQLQVSGSSRCSRISGLFGCRWQHYWSCELFSKHWKIRDRKMLKPWDPGNSTGQDIYYCILFGSPSLVHSLQCFLYSLHTLEEWFYPIALLRNIVGMGDWFGGLWYSAGHQANEVVQDQLSVLSFTRLTVIFYAEKAQDQSRQVITQGRQRPQPCYWCSLCRSCCQELLHWKIMRILLAFRGKKYWGSEADVFVLSRSSQLPSVSVCRCFKIEHLPYWSLVSFSQVAVQCKPSQKFILARSLSIIVVCVLGYKSYVILSTRMLSKCLNNCPELLGLSSFDHAIFNDHMMNFLESISAFLAITLLMHLLKALHPYLVLQYTKVLLTYAPFVQVSHCHDVELSSMLCPNSASIMELHCCCDPSLCPYMLLISEDTVEARMTLSWSDLWVPEAWTNSELQNLHKTEFFMFMPGALFQFELSSVDIQEKNGITLLCRRGRTQRIHGFIAYWRAGLHTKEWSYSHGCCSAQEVIHHSANGRFMEFNTDCLVVWDPGGVKYIIETLLQTQFDKGFVSSAWLQVQA